MGVSGMKEEQALCGALESLEYNLSAVTARAMGIRKRIISEWLNKEEPKRWGKDKAILSSPLTEEQVREMLGGMTKHIESCTKQSKIITAIFEEA